MTPSSHAQIVKPPRFTYLGFPISRVSGPAFIDPLEAIVEQMQDDRAPERWEIIHQLRSFPSAEEMAFRNSLKVRLPAPTPEIAGLRLNKAADQIDVAYEYESEARAIEEMRVTFVEVLALGYRQITAWRDSSMRGAKEVRCVSQSRWLDDVVDAWQESLRRHGVQFSHAFKHYTVFSVDGRIDVIATSCRSIPTSQPAPPDVQNRSVS